MKFDVAMKIAFALAVIASFAAAAQPHKVIVISVDGLDNRYLTQANELGLRIPNIRKLMKEGQVAAGVIGVVPTVTWPSHTTMISGVDPSVHGILGNRRPKSEGGEYYWDISLLKARTLLDAMHAMGRTTAAITWPVTVNAPVTYNLPEYFAKRRGGDMDLQSIESKSVPAGLVANIAAMFPAFRQQWMEDRTRAMAVRYLLKTHQPDLILAHFVDLDSESHDMGPFTREANATLEHIDQLIGDILRDMPPGYVFVLTSDHGFEAVHEEVRLNAMKGISGDGGYVIAETQEGAQFLRTLKSEGNSGIGREIPMEELQRFAPGLAKSAVAAYEPAQHVMFTFGNVPKPARSKPAEAGNHGHWPTRYRAVYLAHGTGFKSERLPEFSQKDIAAKLAAILGIQFTPGPK
jgi:predicted AlkP superfamily pyrophosphatase or phosphodiesterase